MSAERLKLIGLRARILKRRETNRAFRDRKTDRHAGSPDFIFEDDSVMFKPDHYKK